MGPNLYITPPGAFTKFHQDGHGTVDSGHQCLRGYNEVVMLRRLTETHKINAIRILNGKDSSIDEYDALYGLPHAEKFVRCITSFSRPLRTFLLFLYNSIAHVLIIHSPVMLKAGSSLRWPKLEDIAECQRMKYVIQAFLLVFINFLFLINL
jgi:hypothetical protein